MRASHSQAHRPRNRWSAHGLLAKAGGDRDDSTAASSRNDSLRTRSVSDLAARHEHRTEADPQGRRSGLYGATSNTHQPHLWTASAAFSTASGKTFTVPAVGARADFAMGDRAIALAKRGRSVPADLLRLSRRFSCCSRCREVRRDASPERSISRDHRSGVLRGRACARHLNMSGANLPNQPDRKRP